MVRCGCGRDNEDHRRFCGGCGGALPGGCAACGFVNAAADKFCGGCGGVCARRPRARRGSGSKPAPADRTMKLDVADLITDSVVTAGKRRRQTG